MSEAERADVAASLGKIASAQVNKDETAAMLEVLSLLRRFLADVNRIADALEMIANHDGDTPVALARPLDVRIVSQDYEEPSHGR